MATDRERRERIVAALMRNVEEFETGQELSEEGAALMIGAIKAFLAGHAADLPTLLNLKPPSGRKDLTAPAIARRLASRQASRRLVVAYADPPRSGMPPPSNAWLAPRPSEAQGGKPPSIGASPAPDYRGASHER